MELNQAYIDSLSEGERRVLRSRYPSLFWCPNRAQRRLFGRWGNGVGGGVEEVNYPRTHIVTFGNRTGKTEFLAEFLAGVVKGKRYVNPKYCGCKFFDELDKKRKSGELTVWWVCAADLMKKGAPDYKIIQRHIPDASFKRPSNNGVYKEIHVPVMGENGAINIVVHVKTHDQDTISFAGDNLDVIICDEPPPQEHWGEISARMINKHGEMGGRILIGGTPLKIGAFMLDIIEESNDSQLVVHDEGSIWENCHGSELPEEMAKKYNIPWDEKAGMWDTCGHLSLDGIQNAISNWQKSGDPDEITARVDGKFTHVQGRIYKIFNKNVHVIKPYKIPDGYPIIQVVDPHDTRPDCSGWYMITPMNKIVCVMEYPERPFELCTSRSETIPQTCEIWRNMEAKMGISGQIAGRYGDPNFMLDPDPYTMKTKKQLYSSHGFDFNVNINDRVEYGHEKVRQLLFYNRERFEEDGAEPMFQPQLLFFNTMRNHITYMIKYSTKETRDLSKSISETVDPKWKDYPDLVRYAAVVARPFSTLKPIVVGKNEEWDRIKRSREPGIPKGFLSHTRSSVIVGAN